MFACPWLSDSKLRVLTASPMNCQDDFAGRVIDVGDDIGDKGTQELLAGARRDTWSIPGGIEILSKPDEIRPDYVPICGLSLGQSCLARLDTAQRGFPTLLQLCRDEAIVRIAGCVSPFRERGFILGLLKLEFDDASLLGLAFHVRPFRFECRLNRHRFNSPEEFFADRRLDADAAEGQTSGLAQHKIWTLATIDGSARWTTAITYHQSSTAPCAG